MSLKKILILGIGNEILTDDGIGPRLVRDLSGIKNESSLHFEITSLGGLQIIEFIRNYEKVIFIDAIHTHQGKPGDVYHFIPSDFTETLHLSNLHDINFLTALKLGESLNLNLPADIHIIAVEIIEDLEFGENLSPVIAQRYPEILENVNCLLNRILKQEIV